VSRIILPGSVQAAFLAVICCVLLFAGCGRKLSHYREAPVRGDRIVIPLDEVSDGKAHFYTYARGGRQINFFVRTDAKGTVSAYFDACYTCYKQKKGYRQEGPDLVCNECDMKFGLAEEKWQDKSGCDPILLKSTIHGSNLIIDTRVIEKGVKLFG
jgi:uncharacterized membrane protein